jgi:16S rRNA (cytosine967-C5)-methyltransferase
MKTHRLPPDSLAVSLLGAACAVAMMAEGSALPQSIASVTQTGIFRTARGAIQDLAYRAMRKRGQTDALIKRLTSRAPSARLHALLGCSLALLSELEAAPYQDFTVVDQAVAAATADPQMTSAKGMVNAVLRRFLRERDLLLSQVAGAPEARWSYPAWWIDAAAAAYPDSWQSILEAGNRQPPLTLRVNRRMASLEDYRNLLRQQGMQASPVGPVALRLHQPLPVERIPGFAEGMVSVQDAGAQLAAPLLDLQAGMRVLDACAAPGGKTGHILECAEVDLLALDQDGRRLERVRDNLARLKLSAQVRQGDASQADWWDGKPFDCILADVPCTASGIVRRHPDIRWLRRPEDAAQLATLSAGILDNLWQMLGPNGKLLLVTCSLWPIESEAQAAAFATRNRAVRLPAPGQLLPAASAETDHDGLFYALFQKPA